MASVYTIRMLSGEPSSGSPLSVVVPAGRVWIVRDLDATTGTDTAEITLYLNGLQLWSSGPLSVSTGATAATEWRGRQVLRAGETLEVSSAGAFDVSVSGYDFAA